MASDQQLRARTAQVTHALAALGDRGAADDAAQRARDACASARLPVALRHLGPAAYGYNALLGVLRDWQRDVEGGDWPGRGGDTAVQHAEECVRAGLSDDDVLRAAAALGDELLLRAALRPEPFRAWGFAVERLRGELEQAAISVALAMHEATPAPAPMRVALAAPSASAAAPSAEPSAWRLGH